MLWHLSLRQFGTRFAIFAIFLFLAGCAEMAENFIRPNEGPVGPKHAPVLEAVYAQPEIGDGSNWKVYVRASDPDGDLDKIFIGFQQPGAWWAPQFLILPKSQRKELNGAVFYWATVRGSGYANTIYASAQIHVEDRAGNRSETRAIQFVVLQDGTKDKNQPPAGFKKVVVGQMDFPLLTESALVGDTSGDED